MNIARITLFFLEIETKIHPLENMSSLIAAIINPMKNGIKIKPIDEENPLNLYWPERHPITTTAENIKNPQIIPLIYDWRILSLEKPILLKLRFSITLINTRYIAIRIIFEYKKSKSPSVAVAVGTNFSGKP